MKEQIAKVLDIKSAKHFQDDLVEIYSNCVSSKQFASLNSDHNKELSQNFFHIYDLIGRLDEYDKLANAGIQHLWDN